MVDSRAKGARGEYLVRDLLRDHTNLQFERVPMSRALEYLKGDLYVPNERNHFRIEVKNYAESPLTDKIFTASKTNNLIRWWTKVVKQAIGGNQEPLLFFKYNMLFSNLGLTFSDTIILDPFLIAFLINLLPSRLFPFIAKKI